MDDVEQFDHKGDQYKDSCLSAEFGYYNVNFDISDVPEVLVKAWKVTTKGSVYPSEYPQACYKDKDGQRLYYDNGIRSVH